MLEILDTTLREGEQTPYVNFTVDEKVEIAKMLDRVGVDLIEAGDRVRRVQVETGYQREGRIEVRGAISAGDRVVRRGHGGLGKGA